MTIEATKSVNATPFGMSLNAITIIYIYLFIYNLYTLYIYIYYISGLRAYSRNLVQCSIMAKQGTKNFNFTPALLTPF